MFEIKDYSEWPGVQGINQDSLKVLWSLSRLFTSQSFRASHLTWSQPWQAETLIMSQVVTELCRQFITNIAGTVSSNISLFTREVIREIYQSWGFLEGKLCFLSLLSSLPSSHKTKLHWNQSDVECLAIALYAGFKDEPCSDSGLLMRKRSDAFKITLKTVHWWAIYVLRDWRTEGLMYWGTTKKLFKSSKRLGSSSQLPQLTLYLIAVFYLTDIFVAAGGGSYYWY